MCFGHHHLRGPPDGLRAAAHERGAPSASGHLDRRRAWRRADALGLRRRFACSLQDHLERRQGRCDHHRAGQAIGLWCHGEFCKVRELPQATRRRPAPPPAGWRHELGTGWIDRLLGNRPWALWCLGLEPQIRRGCQGLCRPATNRRVWLWWRQAQQRSLRQLPQLPATPRRHLADPPQCGVESLGIGDQPGLDGRHRATRGVPCAEPCQPEGGGGAESVRSAAAERGRDRRLSLRLRRGQARHGASHATARPRHRRRALVRRRNPTSATHRARGRFERLTTWLEVTSDAAARSRWPRAGTATSILGPSGGSWRAMFAPATMASRSGDAACSPRSCASDSPRSRAVDRFGTGSRDPLSTPAGLGWPAVALDTRQGCARALRRARRSVRDSATRARADGAMAHGRARQGHFPVLQRSDGHSRRSDQSASPVSSD